MLLISPSEHFCGSAVLGLQILAALTGRTLHSTLQEYLRRSGWSSVWPLKLGSDILIAGPIHLLCLCDPIIGILMLHKCLVDEPVVSEISIPRQFSWLEKVEPIPSKFRKLFGFTNGLFLIAEASVFENVATWLGSPTSLRPCRQASALFTSTLAAHLLRGSETKNQSSAQP